jgi:hypothetical protein
MTVITASQQFAPTVVMPPVDDRRVGVGIVFPVNGSYLTAQVQQPISISGSVGVDPISSLTEATITVSVDNTSLPPFNVKAADGVWSTKAPVLLNGPHKISVTADAIGKSATAFVQFTVDTVAPAVATISPANNSKVGVSEVDNTVMVTVTATDNDRVAGVAGHVGAGSWASLTVDATDRSTWRGNIPVPASIPLGTQTTLDVRCTDAAGNSASQTVNITTADNTPPTHDITSGPSDGARILNRPSVTFTGTATDRQSGVRAGDGVKWSLDGGVNWSAATTSNNWANWTAEIATPTAKSYTVQFLFTDAAGNSIPDSRQFEMVGAYYQTLEERLSPRAYLDALVQFVNDHAKPDLSRANFIALLEQIFYQPFRTLIDPASGLGQQSVKQLRITIEVLRKYLAAQPQSLLGYWTFNEGSGTAARDSSSNRNDANLTGATWTSGRFGGALSFDGRSYATITNKPELEVGKNGADFSVAFWLYLASPFTGHPWRRIMHKGNSNGERTFALFMHPDNNCVHYRISTTSDPNEGGDSSGQIQTTAWTHVAYVKAGNQLQLYINGMLDSAVPLRGTSISNNGPIYFGNVPWTDAQITGFDGALDDVRLYDFALSGGAVGILASYAAGIAPANEDDYRLRVYEAMLTHIGTSYNEIRFIRAADSSTEGGPQARKALADRLGITLSPAAPDELDQLFRAPLDVTETWLATMFGLPDTTQDPLGNTSMPTLLAWQRTHLQQQWKNEDYPLSSTEDLRPIIDPDLIDASDFANPISGDLAYSLWLSRRDPSRKDSVTGKYNDLKKTLAGKTALDGFTVIVNAVLVADPNDPKTGDDFLKALEADYKDGKDVAPALRIRHLTVAAFLVLVRIRALAAKSPPVVTDAEWNDVCNILVQSWKEQNYAAWRDEESGKPQDNRPLRPTITLAPQYFKISQGDKQLTAWRASETAWRAWQDKLQTRIDQDQAVQDAFNAAVEAAQKSNLPLLRNVLVAQVRDLSVSATGQQKTLEDVADSITSRLQIELRTSGAVQTTRIEQAIETLQGLVFSLRGGLLDPSHPAAGWNLLAGETGNDTEKERNFVEEWTWLGSYDNWRAAMSVFLHPENILLPTLRREQTGAFRGLVRAPGRLTPVTARAAAAAYIADLGKEALIARWQFDEGQGIDTADAMLDSQNGTLRGGVSRVVGRAGGSALSFDGIDDAVDLVAGPKLRRVMNNFTMVFWALPTAVQGNPNEQQSQSGSPAIPGGRFAITPVLGSSVYGSDDHAGVGIAVGTDGIKVRELGNSYFPPLLVHAASLNTWTHIAVVYRDRQPSLYVNGQFIKTGLRSAKAFAHASPAAIGGGIPNSSDYFQGQLDDVSIYDSAFSADAIRLLAKLGQSLITDELSIQDLKDRRTLEQTLFSSPPPDAQTLLKLKEIFYFVPMQIALQLQRSREYSAALAWFRSVYAYNIPPEGAQPPQPKIYYPLQLEKLTSQPLASDPHWARNLNPHDLVAPQPGSTDSNRSYPYTRYTLLCIARCFLDYADAEFARGTDESMALARSLYATARDLLRVRELPPPGVSEGGGIIPPDPALDLLRSRVEMQLAKLRQGRNIAGTSSATSYRFKVLLERSKQLVGIAQQIEAAYLSALEKADAENYNLLKASNDLELATAGEELQSRRVIEAMDGKDVVAQQKGRNAVVERKYNDMIDEGATRNEVIMIGAFLLAGAAAALLAIFVPPAGIAALSLAATLGGGVVGLETLGKVFGIFDSIDRQKQQWDLQLTILQQDDQVLEVQGRLADDHLAVAREEQTIAQMQSAHATAVAKFLATKFTSAELYEWMSGVLGDIYNYFLQQATAMAQLAQSQLAFERAEQPPRFIQGDYWELPSQTAASSGNTPDRRGLTGSARLLEDITQLDQYAFESDRRKLNISQTFSLAQLFPYEFQKFRENGVLSFRTRMELFDRAFPGHYLRLIKRVRTSIIALIPPVQGIRATLTVFGTSKIVGSDFQRISVWREPETVALTAPMNATGVFELDMQSEMLQPFEDHGVDAQWEFRLPKAANPFNFGTIADVLVTIDYTALASADFHQTMIRKLGSNISADRAFSFRNDFPDQWYDINNANPAAPLSVTFNIRRDDFPPNLKNDDIRIEQLLAYFVPKDGPEFEISVSHLLGPDAGSTGDAPPNGRAKIISTRHSSGDPWKKIKGTPIGDWTLTITDPATRSRFAEGKVADILFVVTFAAELPGWV